MFPLAQILRTQGYYITGSDNNESDIVTAERGLGIEVHMGHRAENLRGADMVVYSAAIMEGNPELDEARRLGLPLWTRAQLLGEITGRYETAVGVCGTHGKTTTTSMLTQILYGAGKDPSAVIGGKLRAIGGYGRAGDSGLMVYEACEFRDTFLSTTPTMAIVLNIDNDHMEYFGTVENAMRSYTAFAQKASRVLYNGDDLNTVCAMGKLTGDKECYTFGEAPCNDFYPSDLQVHNGLCRSFDLTYRGDVLTRLTIHVPGAHNVLNAVAAASAAWLLGTDVEAIAENLETFTGAGRRFEVLGSVGGVTIADDYAHHPAELAVTLQAAKELNFNRVWAVFQPFTFSRTYLLLEDFARALSIADRVVMSPIMGSREVNTYDIHTADLGALLPGSVWFDSFEEIAEYVLCEARPGDLVITLGCGDIYKCAKLMLKKGEESAQS